jgi:AhpC/TSA family
VARILKANSLAQPGSCATTIAEKPIIAPSFTIGDESPVNKHICSGAMAILFAATFWLAGQSENAQESSWSGVIINASCNADEAFAEAAKCTATEPGRALALYDDTIRQVYSLEPQDQAKGHLGESVTVQGTLDTGTIHVAFLHMFSEVGLPAGQKAPDFSAADQFGKTQTLATLRGSKGTVLLFYRSADWCPYCKGQLI